MLSITETAQREKRNLCCYKWRENNKERYNTYVNEQMAIYYLKNKDSIKAKRKYSYQYKKECQRLRNILIN